MPRQLPPNGVMITAVRLATTNCSATGSFAKSNARSGTCGNIASSHPAMRPSSREPRMLEPLSATGMVTLIHPRFISAVSCWLRAWAAVTVGSSTVLPAARLLVLHAGALPPCASAAPRSWAASKVGGGACT